MRKMNA